MREQEKIKTPKAKCVKCGCMFNISLTQLRQWAKNVKKNDIFQVMCCDCRYLKEKSKK